MSPVGRFGRRLVAVALATTLLTPLAAQAATDSITGLGTIGNSAGDPNGDSVPLGITPDGTDVVGFSSTSTSKRNAFSWTSGGGMVDLGTLSGDNQSIAAAISADGLTIVGLSQLTNSNDVAQHSSAVEWVNGGAAQALTPLLAGGNSTADGVDANGGVIVGGSDTSILLGNGSEHASHAVIWSGASLTPEDLGTLGPSNANSAASAVSPTGLK